MRTPCELQVLLACMGLLVAAHAQSWADYEVLANNELSHAVGPSATAPSPLSPLHSNEIPGAPGSLFQAPGSPFQAPESRFQGPGSPFQEPGSPFQVPGAADFARTSPNLVVTQHPNNLDYERRNPNQIDRLLPEVGRRDPNWKRRRPNEGQRRNPNNRRKGKGDRRRDPRINEVVRREPSARPKEPKQRRVPGDRRGRKKGMKGEGQARGVPGSGSGSGSGSGNRTRTSYECPAHFMRHGSSCYFLSTKMASWQEAHFLCRDMDSELARLEQRWEDRNMRAYLAKPELAPLERWIGGIYDWEQKQWVWGASAHVLGYQGFSRRKAQADHRWQCIALDPTLLFRWTARSCIEARHFLCETPLREIKPARRAG